jgi:hypothetical protein
MNKKDELQAKRNELFSHSTDTLARIKELDKEIAEAGKPKLRHGDYGTDSNGRECIYMRNPSPQKYPYFVAGKGVSYCNASGSVCVPNTVLGNIFDDIANRGKERSKVSIEGKMNRTITLKYWNNGRIYVEINDTQCGTLANVIFEADSDALDKLQQVINYAKEQK